MKKQLFSLLTLLFLTISFSPKAYAHILQSDGSIGALLHIDPDDSPIAGKQSVFFFEFKDKQGKFSSQNCDCVFMVVENGNTIYSQPLFQNLTTSSSNVSIFYTFPQKDVYQVKVVGKPITPIAFQPFTLVWNWRVDQQVENIPVHNINFFSAHVPHIVGLGIMLLIFFIFIFVKLTYKRIPKAKGGEKKHDKEDISGIY